MLLSLCSILFQKNLWLLLFYSACRGECLTFPLQNGVLRPAAHPLRPHWLIAETSLVAVSENNVVRTLTELEQWSCELNNMQAEISAEDTAEYRSGLAV